VTYFTKAIDLDATRAESFYYRGRANLQLNKTKEAKADFEKVLELAPDSPEGRDAKQLIDSLK
jgi:tetratricopeptide (TPR) repeat protein